MKIIAMLVDMTLPENFVWEKASGDKLHLFVLFKSPAVVTLNNEEIAVDKGDMVLYDKFEYQKYRPTKGEFVHDFVHFDFDNESEQKEFLSIPFSRVIRADNYEQINNILKLMMQHQVSLSPEDKYIADTLGYSFLLMLKSNTENVKEKYFESMMKLRTEIYSNPQSPWTLELMAKKVSLSVPYLQVVYKRTFGISCMNDVINSRIKLSKRLLNGTDLSVAQISEACGYNNVEHFIRQFKTDVGTTPHTYRKSK